jgi:hypothetical protein
MLLDCGGHAVELGEVLDEVGGKAGGDAGVLDVEETTLQGLGFGV